MYPLLFVAPVVVERRFWPRETTEVVGIVNELEWTDCPLAIVLSPVHVVVIMFPVDIGVTKIAVVDDCAVGATGCWCFNKLCGCFD